MAGAAVGSLAFDEFGRPFLILRDQNNQNRITGKDAIKVIISYVNIESPNPANKWIHMLIMLFKKCNICVDLYLKPSFSYENFYNVYIFIEPYLRS